MKDCSHAVTKEGQTCRWEKCNAEEYAIAEKFGVANVRYEWVPLSTINRDTSITTNTRTDLDRDTRAAEYAALMKERSPFKALVLAESSARSRFDSLGGLTRQLSLGLIGDEFAFALILPEIPILIARKIRIYLNTLNGDRENTADTLRRLAEMCLEQGKAANQKAIADEFNISPHALSSEVNRLRFLRQYEGTAYRVPQFPCTVIDELKKIQVPEVRDHLVETVDAHLGCVTTPQVREVVAEIQKLHTQAAHRLVLVQTATRFREALASASPSRRATRKRSPQELLLCYIRTLNTHLDQFTSLRGICLTPEDLSIFRDERGRLEDKLLELLGPRPRRAARKGA